MKLQSAHNHREHSPATRTFDIIARNEHAHASGLTAFGRSRRSFLLKAAFLSLGATFGPLASLARAQEKGRPATERTTKVAQGKAEAKEVDNPYGFAKYTPIDEVIAVLKGKGLDVVVDRRYRIQMVAANGEPYLYIFVDGKFVQAESYSAYVPDGTKPTNFALLNTRMLGQFWTAENFIDPKTKQPVLFFCSITNEGGARVWAIPLGPIVTKEGGFHKPKLVENSEENLVALIAEDDAGNTWKNAHVFDSKTGKYLGEVPSSLVLTSTK